METPLFLLMTSPDAAGGGGSFWASWGILIPLFLIMYLMLIRPQRKKQKEHNKMLTELRKGDKVVTSGGMFGTIFAIQDDKNKIVLKIANEVKVEILKSSIAGKVEEN